MTSNNLPQTNEVRKTSRRDFLTGLRNLVAGIIPLTLLPTTKTTEYAAPEITQTQALNALGYENWGALEAGLNQEPPVIPYGPAERTEAINKWIDRLSDVIFELEMFRGHLEFYTEKPAQAVSGEWLINSQMRCLDFLGQLHGELENGDFEDLTEAVTGKPGIVAFIAWEMKNNDKKTFDNPAEARAFWLNEFAEFSEDVQPQLRAVLNEVYPPNNGNGGA